MHHSRLAQLIAFKKGEQYAKTNLMDQNQKLIRTLGICVWFVLEALGQEECHVILRMLILTSKSVKEPSNRSIDVFPYF